MSWCLQTSSNLPSQRASERTELERKVAMTTTLVSFFSIIVGGIIQAIYPVFRQRFAMRIADIIFL